MSKDLADKMDQYEKLRVSIEEREQTLEAKKVQLAVLQAEFDRTAALVSPKEENADGERNPSLAQCCCTTSTTSRRRTLRLRTSWQ
eukprot:5674265-Pyramimonas_sp.AAC.1